jgi:hypothetical protein
MKKLICVLLQASLAGVILVATACKGIQTAGNNNQTNGNASVQTSDNSNVPQPKVPKSATEPEPTGNGTIEVKTTPPGARIVLIPLDEEGAQPQQKGSTPATLTNIPAGKYTVNIEKPGYKYYQKNIKVQPNKTTQVGAALQKE